MPINMRQQNTCLARSRKTARVGLRGSVKGGAAALIDGAECASTEVGEESMAVSSEVKERIDGIRLSVLSRAR